MLYTRHFLLGKTGGHRKGKQKREPSHQHHPRLSTCGDRIEHSACGRTFGDEQARGGLESGLAINELAERKLGSAHNSRVELERLPLSTPAGDQVVPVARGPGAEIVVLSLHSSDITTI
jgi:hypothetical protein